MMIFYAVIALYRLDWALMFILATLPSYLIRFKILGIPVTFLESMILISFSIWLLKNYPTIWCNIKSRWNCKSKIENNKLRRYPFDIEIILLLVVAFISVAMAGFSQEAFGIWKAYFFEPLLLYILFFNVLHGPHERNCTQTQKITRIIGPLAFSVFYLAAFAVYQKFTGAFIANPLWAAEETRRATSVFGYPNALGLFLGPIILLMTGWIYLIFNQFKKNKFLIAKYLFFGALIFLSICAVYFAKSEGALIGIVAGLIIGGLLLGKKTRISIMVLMISGSFFVYLGPFKTKVLEKIQLNDFSGEIRKQQWRETWKMLTESPQRFVFGSGLANYQKTIKPYHQEGIFFNKDHDPDFRRKLIIFNKEYKAQHWFPVEIYLYPHNIFLNFWAELGLTGMILFVWIIGKFFYLGFKKYKLIENYNLENKNFKQEKNNKYFLLGVISSMIVILVHGLVDVPYFKNDLAILFWVIIYLMGVMLLSVDVSERLDDSN